MKRTTSGTRQLPVHQSQRQGQASAVTTSSPAPHLGGGDPLSNSLQSMRQAKESHDELEERMVRLQEELDEVTEKILSGRFQLQIDDLNTQLATLQAAELPLLEEMFQRRVQLVRARQAFRRDTTQRVVQSAASGDVASSVTDSTSSALAALSETSTFSRGSGSPAGSGVSHGSPAGGDHATAAHWKISEKELHFGDTLLGSGAFGDVYAGR
jgi:hypothetical protein